MVGFWDWLSARFQRPEPFTPEESAARVAAVVNHMRANARPCLKLVTGQGGEGSWLGDFPALPLGDEWPHWSAHPLSFLAQINLAEVRRAGGPEWLPADGSLLFFLEPKRFDHFDRKAWKVIYLSPGTEARVAGAPGGLSRSAFFKRCPIRYETAMSYPLNDRSSHLTDDLTRGEAETVWEAFFAPDDGPKHQIGGYPEVIQGDAMERESQTAWNRDIELLAEPASHEGELPGEKDWRLLLQLDSDDQVWGNWHDAGMLYFWIREQDARAGDFSRTWLCLQSH